MGGTKNALASYLDDRRDRLIDFLRKLVQTKTVNPPGSEAALARLVAEELDGFGIPSSLLDHGDGQASAVGVLKGTGKKGALMLNGHADTVPVGEAPWDQATLRHYLTGVAQDSCATYRPGGLLRPFTGNPF